jgi:hypothetical protein
MRCGARGVKRVGLIDMITPDEFGRLLSSMPTSWLTKKVGVIVVHGYLENVRKSG